MLIFWYLPKYLNVLINKSKNGTNNILLDNTKQPSFLKPIESDKQFWWNENSATKV